MLYNKELAEQIAEEIAACDVEQFQEWLDKALEKRGKLLENPEVEILKDELDKTAGELRKTVKELTSENNRLEIKIENLEKQVGELQDQNRDTESENYRLREDIDELERSVEEQEDIIKNLNIRINFLMIEKKTENE